MLIYFDSEGKDHVIGVLKRLLKTDGILFVGPSEATLAIEHSFVSTRVPLSFAFRKGPARRQQVPASVLKTRPKARLPALPTPAPVALLPVIAPEPSPRPRRDVEDIRRLADQGRLAEAAGLAVERLREGAASPALLHLLGVIRDAAGEWRAAADAYRKALFLDPEHAEALAHLVLLLERQGSTTEAKALRERMRRIEQRKAK
jgi:chemotaxis protein methyltransferase WspC